MILYIHVLQKLLYKQRVNLVRGCQFFSCPNSDIRHYRMIRKNKIEKKSVIFSQPIHPLCGTTWISMHVNTYSIYDRRPSEDQVERVGTVDRKFVQCNVRGLPSHNTALCPSHNNQLIAIAWKCIIHGRFLIFYYNHCFTYINIYYNIICYCCRKAHFFVFCI